MSRKDVLTDKDHRRHDIVNPCVVQEIVAGEDITAFTVVMVIGTELFKYDPTVAANYNKAVGVATTSASTGSLVRYKYNGELDVPFSVTDGAIYYSSGTSTLTTTPNSSGILQEIAQGIGIGRIFIDLKDPVELC